MTVLIKHAHTYIYIYIYIYIYVYIGMLVGEIYAYAHTYPNI